MELRLNMDSVNIGETVVDLFENLSETQREQIATEVLREYLREPLQQERAVLEQECFAEMRKTNSRAKDTDESLRGNWQYREFMDKHKTSKEIMIKQILTSTIEHYKAQVAKEIRQDPQMQAILTEVTNKIKTEYPKIVHDAMMVWFCSNMQQLGSGIATALVQSTSNEAILKQLSEKLNFPTY